MTRVSRFGVSVIKCVAFDFVKFGSVGLTMGGIDVPILKITNRTDETHKPIIALIGR